MLYCRYTTANIYILLESIMAWQDIQNKVRSYTQSTFDTVAESSITIAKYVANAHNRTDFLDYQPPSMFDTAKSHAEKLSLTEQYKLTKEFDNAIQNKLATEAITGSERCVDRLNVIAESYNKTRGEVVPLKNNPLASVIDQLKNEVNELKNNPDIDSFSLNHALFDAKSQALKSLNKQFELDKSDKTNPKELKLLEQNNKNACAAIEQAINDEIKKQLNAARAETARLAFVNLLKELGDKEMLKLLNITDNQQGITATAAGDLPNSKTIQQNIKQFQTNSGRTITQTEDNSYAMKIPTRNNIFYHNGRQDYLLGDLQTLALAVRASGHSKITMEFNGTNEKDMELIAQKAYDACIRTGFQGGVNGDISFKLNGVETPLVDKINSEGKVTQKGIFRQEADLQKYEPFEKQRDEIGKIPSKANSQPVTLSNANNSPPQNEEPAFTASGARP